MSSLALSSQSPFRPDCLAGKVAVVTGGGSGIGFEITRQLLAHGCAAAVICGRRKDFLQQAAQWLQDGARSAGRNCGNASSLSCAAAAAPVCHYCPCDVRDPDQCQDVMDYVTQHFGGRLDILVNGAAGNFLAQAKDLSPKAFATVMNIDAVGTFHMSRAAYPLLAASANNSNNNSSSSVGSNGGIIVNISATLQYGATYWQAHASAAKAAVDSLTRSLALEWGGGDAKIRVVGIAPGPITDTPGTTKLAPGLDQRDIEDMVAEGIPLQRMGHAWEIGLAAVYLCTADYVTGHVLVVDGGQWLYRNPIVPKEMVAELSRQVESKSRAQAPRSKL